VNSLSQSQLISPHDPARKVTSIGASSDARRRGSWPENGASLARRVEVWLRNDIRLQGVLALGEEKLFVPDISDPQLQLIVDGVSFTPSEIVSCVALD